jgi:hypothetical protein
MSEPLYSVGQQVIESDTELKAPELSRVTKVLGYWEKGCIYKPPGVRRAKIWPFQSAWVYQTELSWVVHENLLKPIIDPDTEYTESTDELERTA